MNALEELRELDLDNSTSKDIQTILKGTSLLYVPFYIKKGIIILRGRKGKGLRKRSQFTYPPKTKCKSLQRANLIGETLFYGVLSDEPSHLENARAIVTCDLISATIASDILKESNVDGIAYPSVQLGGQCGINIALIPQSVNKKLRFIDAFDQVLYKNKTKSIALICHKNIKTPITNIETELEMKLTDFPLVR